MNKFKLVWRFSISWLLLFGLISGCVVVQLSELKSYYQTIQPVSGGIYSEGIEGTFTTANPLYAVNEVDTSVSRLIFASLLSYDNHNQLIGDLANSWSVDSSGTIYTVHLRPDLTWQDGKPLTAADVVFTYQTIQNPNAQSPLFSSWQDVQVAALNSRTITFTLPNPLSSFPYSLTTGIVPKHILQSINVASLRSAIFNTDDPIGAGPFQWSSFGASNDNPINSEDQINLIPFQNYWAGTPKLSGFTINTYPSNNAMFSAYQSDQITAMVDLSSVPSNIAKDATNQVYNLPITAAVYVFFKTSDPILKDPQVRQALVDASNQPAIIAKLSYPAIPVNEPLLEGQLGYDRAYAQVTNQPSKAVSLLNADGWILNSNGIRVKNGQPLTFSLLVPSNPEYIKVAKSLSNHWRAFGIVVKVQIEQQIEFQDILSSHAYDAVLDGISIGVDPDVYVYWDSSQAAANSSGQLNFSEYRSSIADASLEAGRTRLGDQLRSIKYQSFLQVWQQDAPALGLYQPRLFYISHVPIYGLGSNQVNTAADRFNNVQNWMIQTGWVTNPT
ncbi:MAG: ABC transporter substrate-binding protein [Candidatus Saccharimonadales bacterium]